MELPIIRLELERCKDHVMHALATRSEEINAEVERQLKEVLTPEYLQRLIAEQMRETIPKAIKGAVDRYFVYGEGRKMLERSITQQLNDENPAE